MAKIRAISLPLRDFKNLPEVQLLRRPGHDPDRVSVQILDAVINGGDVRGGVIVSAVPFANDAWFVREIGNIAEENADCALADFGQTSF